MLKNYSKYITLVLAILLPLTSLANEVGEKPINTVPGFFSSSSTMRIPLLKSYDSETSDGSELYSTDIQFNADGTWSIKNFQAVQRVADTTWYDSGFDTALAAELETFLDKLMVDPIGQPSVALLVEVDGKAWRGVRGPRRMTNPNQLRTFDDGYRVGSLTKLFTSAVVLQLIDEGRVSMDDTLGKWFSGESWFESMANNDVITVEQLFNHQSGIYNYTVLPEFTIATENPFRKVYTPEYWIEAAVAQGSQFNPGDKYEYTNTGYLMLGLLIEKELGLEYEIAVDERILQPLNMNRSSISRDPEVPYPYTHGHSLVPTGINVETDSTDNSHYLKYDFSDTASLSMVNTYLDPSIAWSAGSLISNMDDMNKFIKAYVNGSMWGESTQAQSLVAYSGEVFGQVSLSAFGGYTGSFYQSGNAFEMFEVPDGGQKYWGHFGQITGYDSGAFYNPEKKISFVINGGSYDANAAFTRAINFNSIELISILENHTSSSTTTSFTAQSARDRRYHWVIPEGKTFRDIVPGSGF